MSGFMGRRKSRIAIHQFPDHGNMAVKIVRAFTIRLGRYIELETGARSSLLIGLFAHFKVGRGRACIFHYPFGTRFMLDGKTENLS